MEGLRRRARFVWQIVRTLKIEPFAFLFVLSTSMAEISTAQLIQDKICLNKYNQTPEFCIGVSALKTQGGDAPANNTKSLILADLAQFNIYLTLISSLPSFFYVLFIGSWTDSYIHGRKICLLLGTLGYIGAFAGNLLNSIKFELEVHYILLSYVSVALTGGWSCVWLNSFSYMSNNTPEEYRLIKFCTFEIASAAAGPLGTYLGGILLGSGKVESEGQLHDYERVFTWCTVSCLSAFFWVLIVINENKNRINDENSNLINTAEDDFQEYSVRFSEPTSLKQADRLENGREVFEHQLKHKKIETKFRFAKMFDLDNLREVFRTAIKKRPNKGRAQIWLLYLCMCSFMLSDGKNFQILFPFVEEVYDWDAKYFSEVKSLSSIIQIVTTALVAYTLSGYYKVSDTKLGLFGFVSVMFADLCVGSIISPIGLYLLYLIGSPSAIGSTSIRSLLSKLASESESGRIFSLLAALETIVPPISSFLYNTMFEYTINFYPSLSFQIGAAIIFTPILIYIWIDLTKIHLY